MFNKQLLDSIKDALIKGGETIAVAESVTSGLLQTALTFSEEAMKIFQGGITAYNMGQKYRHLLVDPIHAQACFCVSQRVANEMALRVCDMFSSDWGIGITGFASPVPESENRVFAYYAVSHRGEIVSAGVLQDVPREPLHVKLEFVDAVLSLCANAMASEGQESTN